MNTTQIAVIGAGHAGIEAALAAARMGVETVLCTMSLDAVANMPCNPSIGGTAKGHLVYEIDALGGEMGRAADLVTLQSRTLNTGKGAAVQSKRIQADRLRYHALMKQPSKHRKTCGFCRQRSWTYMKKPLTEKQKSRASAQDSARSGRADASSSPPEPTSAGRNPSGPEG